ncbi:hypothetical protein PoB_003794500 [Plakobranchus ocellatus]|uniref:Uncharacterized protein n=1 Tax=Plakobranchus ocellatus TaxID=259542 RepID=A0AAV4ASY2_9GAST|nr:hypothetical protein PoB_003794500 [Plakobranchus ocellatus]
MLLIFCYTVISYHAFMIAKLYLSSVFPYGGISRQRLLNWTPNLGGFSQKSYQLSIENDSALKVTSKIAELVLVSGETINITDASEDPRLGHALRGSLGGVGDTVDSESALRSAEILLSRVRAPPPAPRPDRGPESLKSTCCTLATYKS